MFSGSPTRVRALAHSGAGSFRRRARVGPVARNALLALVPLVLVIAVEAGGAAVVSGAAAEARHLHDVRDFPGAVAEYQTAGNRSGVIYLLAGSGISDARHQAQLTLLDWAASLAASGRVDEALEMSARVSEPGLLVEARRQRAAIALDDARRQEGAGHADLALSRLDQVTTLDPPAEVAAAADQLRPGYALAAARLLLIGATAQPAVVALDEVVRLAPGTDGAAEARRLLPQALLAGAQQALGSHDQATALTDLNRLTSTFAATTEAATARTLLATPQRVIGTLVHRDGSAAAGVRVRLASNYRRVANGFVTSGPYYYGRTDPQGDFSFDQVPVGAALTFEFIDQGSWTVLETQGPSPDQRHPADSVMVTPLTPVDLAFVRLP